MKKIAIIVQRYGMQINGGAEMHARMIAEKLSLEYNITILTSCAIDYHTWKPILPVGESFENNIKIIRFKNLERNTAKQEYYYNKIKKTHFVYCRYKLYKLCKFWIPFNKKTNYLDHNNISWLKYQGPETPDLIEYLKNNVNNYDAFLFFTTLYYTTALGILNVASKSILIPTMHYERASFFPIYQKVMQEAKWIFYNTVSEKKFSEKIFPSATKKNEIVAVGIETPIDEKEDYNILNKFGIQMAYLIYVGRIDKSKGCDSMIKYFTKYIKITNVNIQLVLVGKSVMQIENHPFIIQTGFVTDSEKTALIKHAHCLIMPSKFESLSLVLLESFACKVPVIANGNTEVLKDHILISEGGWCYYNYNTFQKCLKILLNNRTIAKQRGENGYKYVSKNYTWNTVIQKFNIAIKDIIKNNSTNKKYSTS